MSRLHITPETDSHRGMQEPHRRKATIQPRVITLLRHIYISNSRTTEQRPNTDQNHYDNDIRPPLALSLHGFHRSCIEDSRLSGLWCLLGLQRRLCFGWRGRNLFWQMVLMSWRLTSSFLASTVDLEVVKTSSSWASGSILLRFFASGVGAGAERVVVMHAAKILRAKQCLMRRMVTITVQTRDSLDGY